MLHLHGYTKALTTTPALAAHRAGFTVVCTLHDFFSACPNGAFFDYRRERPCTLRAMSTACVSRNCDKRHPAHKAYRVLRGVAQRDVARFPRTVRDYITVAAVVAAAAALPAGRRAVSSTGEYHPRLARATGRCGGNQRLCGGGQARCGEGGDAGGDDAARNAGLPITFVGEGGCAPTWRRPVRVSPAG